MKVCLHAVVWIGFCLLCFSSCTHQEAYYRFHSFDNSVWHKDSVACFEVSVADSLSAHDVFLEIRNNNAYPYKNIWLFVDFELPSGSVRKDTIECILADEFGKWYGNGLSLYNLTVPYEENLIFPQTGIYTYKIRQAMRNDILTGISDIGVKIVDKKHAGD